MKFGSDVFNDFSLYFITISSVTDSSWSGSSHILLLLYFLLFSSLIQNNVQLLLSQTELIFNFAVSTNCTLDPWMWSNLLNFWSFIGIISNHFTEKVFKLFTEIINRSSSWVSLPESIKLFILQKLVIRVAWDGFFERWVSSIHDEKNDSWGKNIALCAIVIFSWNLRSHVPFSSEFSMKNASSIFSFQKARESKVS